MENPIERKVTGFLPNGETIYLGKIEMTDEHLSVYLKRIAEGYDCLSGGSFRVNGGVFSTMSFIGVHVSPPPKS